MDWGTGGGIVTVVSPAASQWSDTISDNPHVFVSLSRVSSVVNEFFHLDVDDQVKYDTPFVWWDRSKRNIDIANPMPVPVAFTSANDRGPLWHQDQIVHWFGQWRRLPVPECSQAGDKVSRRGHFVPSPHREVS